MTQNPRSNCSTTKPVGLRVPRCVAATPSFVSFRQACSSLESRRNIGGLGGLGNGQVMESLSCRERDGGLAEDASRVAPPAASWRSTTRDLGAFRTMEVAKRQPTIAQPFKTGPLPRFLQERPLNSPSWLSPSRSQGIETSRRGDTAAFFVRTRFLAMVSDGVTRRTCLTRLYARLPHFVTSVNESFPSLELSVARRVSG